MAITRLNYGSSFTNLVKSDSFLDGNSYYVPPSFDSIATVALTSNASSITFSSIPSTYTHLQIRYSARKTTSGIGDIVLSFNSLTASNNYAKHWGFSFDGGGPYISGGGNTTVSVGYLYGDDSGVKDSGIIDILDYKDANKNKTVRYLTGNEKVSTGTSTVVWGSGLFINTGAISSITLDCSTIQSGGHFALYGIKGE